MRHPLPLELHRDIGREVPDGQLVLVWLTDRDSLDQSLPVHNEHRMIRTDPVAADSATAQEGHDPTAQ